MTCFFLFSNLSISDIILVSNLVGNFLSLWSSSIVTGTWLLLTFVLQLFFMERHFLTLVIIANTDNVIIDDITIAILRMSIFSKFTNDCTLLYWLESRISKSLDLLN